MILGTTLFLGFLVRFFPGFLAGFPLNDGGMFLTMIQDLQENGFRLPAFTTYNLAQIPFAYPPLGFYLGAALAAVGIPPLQVLRWLPPLANFLSILAFYRLAEVLLQDKPRAAVASMAYALLPGSFAWHIMGGGLTRALGMLFILCTDECIYRSFRDRQVKMLLGAVFFGTLAVLSHPEVALATMANLALFWLFFGRSRQGTGQAALIAVGVALCTSPWWGSVLAYHGLKPFFTVMHSGAYILNPLTKFLSDFSILDGWTGPFHALVWVGIGWAIWKRRFFFLAWLALPYFTEPRSAPAFAHFPASMLVALAMMEALPAFWARHTQESGLKEEGILSPKGTLVLLGVTFFWFVQSAFFGLVMLRTSLVPPAPQQAMQWVAANTPSESCFFLLTGQEGAMIDPWQEWFPALSGRCSRSTLQGLEWTLGEAFFPRLRLLSRLQECRQVTCVEAWEAETGLTYDYLWVAKNPQMESLLVSARQAGYRTVFENAVAVIYSR